MKEKIRRAVQRLSGKNSFALILILAAASFLRLYSIRDYIIFLGDEGRDALVWLNIVEKGKFTLLGPTASVSGFYLGPIYYYLALPFYWIWRDPVGPAIFVALTGIATVWLIWFINQKWFGPTAGLFSAWSYATANLIIRYSRASWNPNPLPFFSLLGLYWISNGSRHNKIWQIAGAGVCLGIAWQLHYLALILTPVYILIIFTEIWLHHRQSLKNFFSPFIVYLLIFILGWLTSFSPFLIFEFRHNFPNTRSVIEFITRPGGAVLKFEVLGLSRSFIRNLHRLFYTVFSWQNNTFSFTVAAIVTLTGTIIAAAKQRWSLLIWILLSLSVLSLYQGNIENYYYGLLFPAPFILTGILVDFLFKKSQISRLFITITAILFALNQSRYWFIRNQPNHILEQTNRITNEIIRLSDNNPFNFALITAGNSDHAYRYFLEKKKATPTPLKDQITSQLIAVCEKQESECQPLGNPIWEIAGFGRAEIAKKITVPPGLTLYRLKHYSVSVSE